MVDVKVFLSPSGIAPRGFNMRVSRCVLCAGRERKRQVFASSGCNDGGGQGRPVSATS